MLPALNLRAQKPITIMEDSLLVGKYMHPELSVTIPEANYDKTLKNWIKQMEAGTKSKVVTEDGMMTIFGAMLKENITKSGERIQQADKSGYPK